MGMDACWAAVLKESDDGVLLAPLLFYFIVYLSYKMCSLPLYFS